MKGGIFSLLFLFSSVCCLAQKTETLTVYFGFNENELDAVSKNRIDSVLDNHSVTSVQISAHCDSIGSSGYNDGLSLKRALEVKHYLISKKLKEELINTKAWGKRFPLNKNVDEQARALNRRAELIFTLKDAEPVVTEEPAHADVSVLNIVEDSGSHYSAAKPGEPARELSSLNMDSVEVGSAFRLSNLNFVGGRHKLLPESGKTLELLLEIMKTNPKLKIEIDGYVCCTRDNMDGHDWDTGTNNLSFNRARVIYEYLISKGIDRRRLYYFGRGGSNKLVVERTEADREMNRRVEIKILEK